MEHKDKKETEIVGPIRIEKEVMAIIREVAEVNQRSYAGQINYVLKRWSKGEFVIREITIKQKKA